MKGFSSSGSPHDKDPFHVSYALQSLSLESEHDRKGVSSALVSRESSCRRSRHPKMTVKNNLCSGDAAGSTV